MSLDKSSKSKIHPELYPFYGTAKMFRNTFLQFTWLWYIIFRSEHSYEKRLNKPSNKYLGYFYKLVWFWPNIASSKPWYEGTMESSHSPKSFEPHSQGVDFITDEIRNLDSGFEAPILDLGCNCGRYLNALAKIGYTNLHGVDIERAAFDHMAEIFPHLNSIGHFSCSTFQEFLTQATDQQFEIVYTCGATVELVHPSFPLVREIARVTKRYVLFDIREHGRPYPRLWTYEFARNGFVLIKLLRHRFFKENHSDSFLVYERLC